MKTLIHLFLTFLFLLPTLNAQEQHHYGPVKENNFITVFRDNGSTAGHLVGKTAGGFPIRNFNFWTWDYNDIPTEAELTNVNIKFKAYRNTTEAFNFGLYAVPIEWEWPQTWFSLLNNDDYLVYNGSITLVNGIAIVDVTFIEGPFFNSVRDAIQSGENYLTFGIKQYPETGGQWSIYGYDGTSGMYPCIDLTINFTTPDNYYTFKNKIQTSENV